MYSGAPTTIVDKTIDKYPAQQAGIHKGDKILQIGGQDIKNFKDIQKTLDGTKAKSTIVKIERDNKTKNIEIKPKEFKQKLLKLKHNLHFYWVLHQHMTILYYHR